METQRTATRFCIAVVAAAAIAGVFGAHSAAAATLSFSPSAGTYLSGRSFTVAIKVSSADQAMNAVQGEISFPVSKLEVLSVSKANSVLNLWVQDPTFSNYDGTVNFSGVAVNPGYQGANGTVLTVTFEAKNPGDAPLSFITSQVLANDGLGTNILSGTSGADFTVTPLSAAPPAAAGQGPPASAPGISINSTPAVASDSWYNISRIAFNWSVPANAQGVDYTISNNANLQLPDVSQGLVSQTSYDLLNFDDGTWYFFVSFESGSSWSPPIAMVVNLDRTPPDPFVITREDANDANTQPAFAWAATDQTSGIDHYEMKIGDGDWFDPSILANGSSSYVLPPQSLTSGRTLTVRAFDKAGNYRDASITFRVLAPGAPCTGNALSCGVSAFFAVWGWLVAALAILLLAIAYGFIYSLLRWKRQSKEELQKFGEKLRSDLQQMQSPAQGSHTAKTDFGEPDPAANKELLENQIRRAAKDVDEEVKKLEEQ